ncbi:MAG: hypothetical protein IBX58_12355 [Roseovarius sp.]|nr:hypothetical protein [Roseovarius sp.]
MNNQPQDESFVTIFDDTYDQPDCRAYFRMLDALGYRNQMHAVALFRKGLGALCRVRGLAAPRLLDFASSYGLVTLLMRHEISLIDVFDRYRAPDFDRMSPAEVIAGDRTWLARLPCYTPPLHVIGLDVMPNAIAYGHAVGLFDEGFAENLEVDAPSPALAAALGQVDMIVECGSVAQLMPRTLDRVLTACGERKPWIMTSPIRGNERAAAVEVLVRHGMRQEVLPVAPFIHRRFESPEEQARAIANARAAGHAPEGYETTGHFHAQVLLARPEGEGGAPGEWPELRGLVPLS